MRTAEYHLKKIYDMEGDEQDLQIEVTLNPSIQLIIKAINEARIEAIKECAEVAETSIEHDYHGDGEGYEYNIVDKQSILNLIEQVK